MTCHPLLTLLVLATTAHLHAQEPATPLWPKGEAPYHNAEIDSDRPKLIAYYADPENGNGASIVVCPGGGYGGLAADHEGHQIAQFFNDHGVNAFVLHYRLGSKGYHYPAQLADVQRAIRTVRDIALSSKRSMDGERIGVIGFSAGGHLASMAATLFDRRAYPANSEDRIDSRSARPDFAVLCYPVISMKDGVTHDGSRRNLSGKKNADDKTSKILSLSSELNVPANAPPTFLFHTSEDSVVPAANPIRFYEALLKNNIPAELHIYQRGPHGVGLYRGDPTTGTWSKHLVAWLRNNGIFAGNTERVAVKGDVSLDGEPVSWGCITFQPEDENLPITALRIRNGKFQADSASGPVIGRTSIHFEASIWEKTQDPKDRVIQTDRLSPGDVDALYIKVETGETTEDGPAPLTLSFDLKSAR
jgi:acetyl esterase/lipase